MGSRICNFRMLMVAFLCMSCLDGVAQQRVIRRQAVIPKVAAKNKREMSKKRGCCWNIPRASATRIAKYH